MSDASDSLRGETQVFSTKALDLVHEQRDRLAELEAENVGFEKGARCDRDEIESLKAELLTAKNAYEQIAGIHHRTNDEWKKDATRARVAEGLLSDLWLRFDEHVQASTGDRKHTWMDALRYIGASPTKSPSEPDCDNCPQPHDEYNEPDCDACDAAWANKGGTQ